MNNAISTIGNASTITTGGYIGGGGGSTTGTIQWSYPNYGYPYAHHYGNYYPVYPTYPVVITYPATSPDLEQKLDELTEQVKKLRKELKRSRAEG